MKVPIIVFILLLIFTLTSSYKYFEPKECGTQVTNEQREYMLNIDRIEGFTPSNETIFVLVEHHVFTKDNKAPISSSEIEDQMKSLNEAYEKGGIQFAALKTKFHENPKYYDYYSTGFDDDKEVNDLYGNVNAFNVYWMNTVNFSNAIVCGYAYFPPTVPIAILSSSPSCRVSTLAHELGHVFGLYHTHEGHGDPNREEYVDGTECDIRGDYVCDTPADPSLNFLNVNQDCKYIGTAKDRKGDTYEPDATNIMSYSIKECRTTFTQGQFERMKKMSLSEPNREKTFITFDIIGLPESVPLNSSLNLTITNSRPSETHNYTWFVTEPGEEEKNMLSGLNTTWFIVDFLKNGYYTIRLQACYGFESMEFCISRKRTVLSGVAPMASPSPQPINFGTGVSIDWGLIILFCVILCLF